MSSKHRLLASAALLAALGGASGALAQTTGATGQPASAPAAAAASSQSPAPAAANSTSTEIVVTAQRLSAARETVSPALGATDYSVTNATIQALPGGDNQQLNQIILQLPGVVQDSYGQLHVRDDHNDLQYRINGVILPDGVAVFGQTLSPRLIDKLDLITGALPAQYGLRTAGIVDITTKSGFDRGGQVSIYGGSHGEYEPSFEYGGAVGNTNFFVSGDFRRDQLGIESVDGRSTPDHDRTDQGQVFAYLDHILSANDRVTLVGGYSDQRFQIPNPTGLNAAVDGGGFALNGRTDYPSELLNERQRERTAFTQLSVLHDGGPLTLQASLFTRFSQLAYSPDVTGELLFNGEAQRALKEDVAAGLQIEGAYRLTDAHTVRFGFIFQDERGRSQTTTEVFATDATGRQTSDVPITLADRSGQTQNEYSLYLQDEWRILSNLTLNFGGRYDRYDAYRSQDQFSPRVNLVWKPLGDTTVHVGLRSLLQPAAVRAGGHRDGVAVPGHHGRLDAHPGHHALRREAELLRRRRAAARVSGSRPERGRGQLLPPVRRADRRGPVRRADHPDALQLPEGPHPRDRGERQLRAWTVAHLRQRGLHARPGREHQHQPIQLLARRSRLHPQPLHLP